VSFVSSFLSSTAANGAPPSPASGGALNSWVRFPASATFRIASVVQPLVLSGFVDLAGHGQIGGLLDRQDRSGEACLLEKFTRSPKCSKASTSAILKNCRNVVTIPDRAALPLVLNSMKRVADVPADTNQLRHDDRLRPALTLRSEVLLRNQAVPASRSWRRLRPCEKGAQNEMNARLFNKGSQPSPAAVLRTTHRWVKDPAARLIARIGIHAGARTANRLLWSLWLSLPFALWLSSDWIGMIVLWQAMSASARLLRNSTDGARSAGSVQLNVIQGGVREH
jgi:hypothetical protein